MTDPADLAAARARGCHGPHRGPDLPNPMRGQYRWLDAGARGGKFGGTTAAGEPISDSNGLAVVAAVTAAFPTKHVLINAMTSPDFTPKALAANPNLGIRTDALGCPDMCSMVAVDRRLQQVWRTRPLGVRHLYLANAGRTKQGAYRVGSVSVR